MPILCRAAVALLVAVVATGCRPASSSPTVRLQVVASVAPLAFVAARIAGDEALVTTLIPAGAHPETHELSPSGALALARADVYLGVGAERLALERRFLAAGASGGARQQFVVLLEDELAAPDNDRESGHDDADVALAHAHDPHLWLEPEAMRRVTVELAEVLAAIDVANADQYRRRSEALQLEIAATVERLQARLGAVAGKTVFVQHPSWGLLLGRFGVHEHAIEAESKGPSARRLAATIDAARTAGCRVVVVEPRRSRREAEVLAAAVGAELRELDPLAYDWLANLERMGAVVAEALEAQRG